MGYTKGPETDQAFFCLSMCCWVARGVDTTTHTGVNLPESTRERCCPAATSEGATCCRDGKVNCLEMKRGAETKTRISDGLRLLAPHTEPTIHSFGVDLRSMPRL